MRSYHPATILNTAKHCWVMSTNFLFSKVYWQRPAMFCLSTSSKLSLPLFEFSLKVKVMGLSPGYFLNLFQFKKVNKFISWNKLRFRTLIASILCCIMVSTLAAMRLTISNPSISSIFAPSVWNLCKIQNNINYIIDCINI